MLHLSLFPFFVCKSIKKHTLYMQRDKKQNWAECHAGDMAGCECVVKRQTTGRVHLPKCEFFTR